MRKIKSDIALLVSRLENPCKSAMICENRDNKNQSHDLLIRKFFTVTALTLVVFLLSARLSPTHAAISFSNLGTSANPDINSSTDATSYSNTSWTPPASGLILLFVYSREAAGNNAISSVTGNGITWTQIATVQFGASNIHRLTLFGANASGSSTGTTTIDYGANTQLGLSASFFQATGVDLSGGVAASFVQSPTNTDGGTAGTSGSVTLAAAGDSNNRPIAVFMHTENEATTERANWTEVDDLSGSAPLRGTETQYRSDAFETTASASWTTSSRWGGIAAELKAEAASFNVSGTVYLENESTAATSGNGGQCDGSTANLSIKVNGAGTGTTTCSATDGSFTFTGVSANAGDTITIYSTATDKSNRVYVSDGTADTGMNLYKNAVAIGDEQDGTVTNADLGDYDNDNDATNLLFTANTNTLTVESGVELHIHTGDTFDPGGTVDTNTTGGDLHVDDSATAYIDTATSTIGADVLVDNGATLYIDANTNIDGGDITLTGTGSVSTSAGTPTVTLSGGGTIGGGTGTLTFYNLTIDSTGTTTLNANLTINNDLTLGDATNAHTLDNETNDKTIDVNGSFTIAANATFTSSSTATQTIAGSYTNSGTLTEGTGTITFDGATAATLTSGCSNEATCTTQNFYNVTINKTSASDTVTLSTNHLRVTNTLTITTGTLVQGALNVRAEKATASAVSIGANGTWSNTSTGDITMGAGGISNAGTVSLQAGGTCGGTDDIAITAVSGTPSWSGAGTYTMEDVSVTSQNAAVAITVYSGTDGGGNTGSWTFNTSCPVNNLRQFTLAVWANPSTSITTKALLVKNNEIRLVTDASGNPLCQIHNGTAWQTAATSSTALSLSSWQHVGCAYDQTTLRVFVNGALTASQVLTETVADTANGWEFGRDAGATYGDYNGKIDEVRIYNRALSVSEVERLYNWAPGPVGYWNLDENTGTSTVYDRSGNGNNGTMNGSMTESDWVPGKYGSGLDFDGSDDNISRADDVDFDFAAASNFTLEAWVKHNTQSAGQDMFISKFPSTGGGSNGGPTNIDDLSNFGYLNEPGRRLVRTSTGTLYAFITDDFNSCEVWKSTDGSSWAEQDSANNPTCNTVVHDVAIDSSDNLHLIYNSVGSIKYRTFSTSSDTFTGSEETVFTGQLDVNYQVIAVDSNGIPHVIVIELLSDFFTNKAQYLNRVGGSWDATPVTLETMGGTLAFTGIAINEDNIPEITYININDNDLTAAVGNQNDATSFTLQDVDTNINNNNNVRGASIAVDSSGNTWIGYIDENGATDYVTLVKHQDADAWTTWQTPVTNSNAGNEPSIAINGGDVYIFYEDDLDDIVYDRYNGSWLGETTLQTGTYQDVHAKWSYYNNNQGSNQIDYLYSDATDVFWASLGLSGNSGPGYKLLMEADGDITFGIDDDTVSFPEDSATSTAATYDDNTWHHVAGVKTGTTDIKLYIDGVLIDTDSTIAATGTLENSGGLYFGIDGDGSSNGWMGQLDDVRIYNYARTAKQIIEDMNAGHPAGGSPVGSQVGYWKFDEGYGTTANDQSTNGNDLTLSTASWTNSGKFGKAFSGGDNKRLTRADDADFDFAAGEEMTISVWFKRNTVSATEYLVNKDGTADNIGYTLYMDSDGDIVFGIGDTNSASFPEETIGGTLSKNYDDDAWHHAVAVKSGTSFIRLYVDGREIASDTSLAVDGSLANDGKLIVGDANETDGTDEFLGTIDELKIYRYAMNADDVKLDYNQGKSIVLGALSSESSVGAGDQFSSAREYCVPGGSDTCNPPVEEWKLDEKTGTSANDTSTNGNTGTLGGDGAGSDIPTWQHAGQCQQGACLKFDGTDDYVGGASSFTIPSVTVQTWIKLSATPSNRYEPIQLYSSGGSCSSFCQSVHIMINTSRKFNFVRFYEWGVNGKAWDCTNTDCVIPLNQWTHIAAVHDSSVPNTVNMYINGTLVQTITSPQTTWGSGGYPTTVVNTKIGFSESGSPPGEGRFLNGYMDEVMVYDYARTQAQIAWDYNRGKPQWNLKMDQTSGTTANDSGPLDKDGTLAGDASFNTTSGNCKYGYCVNLDGTGDYITAASVSPLAASGVTGVNQASWGGWYYLTATNGTTSRTLFDKATEVLKITTDANSKPICTFNASSSTAPTTALSTTTWYHLLCTYDGSNIKLYLNGRLADTTAATTTMTASSSTVSVGVASDLSTGIISGRADEQYIFNYPLTAQQVQLVYNQNSAVSF